MSALDESDGPSLRPIFVYGSLLHSSVYERVTGKHPDVLHSEAILSGFQRKRVKNKPYPACIPNSGGSVIGKLIKASIGERVSLDVFESDYYKRITADVSFRNQTSRADVYVWNRDLSELDLDGNDWSFEEFMKQVADSPFRVSFDELQS